MVLPLSAARVWWHLLHGIMGLKQGVNYTQVLTAEIGPERGGESTTGKGESDEAAAASEAAASVAQGQATQAKSMGAAIKDFLTTPQVQSISSSLPLQLLHCPSHLQDTLPQTTP